MITVTARVAPEKAAFRPALPCGRVANAFADLGTEQVEDFFHLFRELNPEGFAAMVNKAYERKK